MTDWTELEYMDQVSFWIGRVSRADTNMDAMLHTVYEQMVGLGYGDSDKGVPWQTSRKLEDLKKMLRKSGRPQDEVELALNALRLVKSAHDERNAVVHGHWSRSPEDPSVFDRHEAGSIGEPPTVTWEVAEFEKCFVNLAHANEIAGGVHWLALYWKGVEIGDYSLLGARERMAARFELSNINDSGGGIGSFIRYTGDGVEAELVRLGEIQSAKLHARLAGVEWQPFAGDN